MMEGKPKDDQLGRFLREWLNEILNAEKKKETEKGAKLFGKKLSDL